MARISAAQREEVRRRLLETAAAHFAEHGLEGAQVDAIALAAGFAKGTLYNYFASKEELFAEVLAEGCRQAVQRYASVPREGSVRECLLALAAADVAVLREEEQFMKVVIREAMSFRPQTYPLIVAHLAPYVAEVEKVLARGRTSREIRKGLSAPQLALVFVGILVLLFVQHWGSGGAWPTLDEIPQLVVTLFLDGAAHAAPRRARARAGRIQSRRSAVRRTRR
jgi:AcrR family transcriptional regulator